MQDSNVSALEKRHAGQELRAMCQRTLLTKHIIVPVAIRPDATVFKKGSTAHSTPSTHPSVDDLVAPELKEGALQLAPAETSPHNLCF
jgi:hypothetical protein